MDRNSPPSAATALKNHPWNSGCPCVWQAQKKLLQKALTPWPRRNSPLLEINCGDGPFLHFFWQCGFEIAATEEMPEARQQALKRNIPKLDLRGAPDDDLPFEDESLDWVVLNIRHPGRERLEAAIQEALRVGKRGIMITFWNKSSLAGLLARLRHKKETMPASAIFLRDLLPVLHSLALGGIKIYSTLCLPDSTWEARGFLATMNTWLANTPLGAWCVIRLEADKGKTVTPLPLRLAGGLREADASMKFIQKQEQENLNRHG